ncbi:Succinate dehydrogenase flavin-adding protein, antitoxin of CptAB toxin-antitoxin [hydrothermal vent metagenome]|uniref:Succinate dehydrogenase flavin-adding protein, antitoxin of CptAB toxin-antitoxin n=1 Tax=hydrothermal vent metagenome TaxID=652676 RepID=A0A3B1A1R1_9ZZZZ
MAVEKSSKSRLYWQCRRGMLELDTLLLGFMDKKYNDLDNHYQLVFESVLGNSDPLLLDYLMGNTIPADKDVAYVIKKIQEAVES